MKAVVEMSNSELAYYGAMANRVLSFRGLIEVRKRPGYSKYDFTGSYTQALVDALGHHPTAEEIIILVDGGYCHFGASCQIHVNSKKFNGTVYTD